MRIGLYFGSFNPPHKGHVQIALQCIEESKLDEVWFIVSPQNPFKQTQELAHESDRLAMVKLASKPHAQLVASDIEFSLPRPSFTCDTLRKLTQQFTHEFYLIIGGDNWQNFHRWKEYLWILQNFRVLIYRRPESSDNNEITQEDRASIHFISGQQLVVSATAVRNSIRNGENVDELIDDSVKNYIQEHRLYV